MPDAKASVASIGVVIVTHAGASTYRRLPRTGSLASPLRPRILVVNSSSGTEPSRRRPPWAQRPCR